MISRSPVFQAFAIVIVSVVIGIGVNAVRTDSIPLLAQELEAVESLDQITNQGPIPQIRSVGLEQAKSLFDQGILFVDAREVEEFDKGHIKGAYPYTNFMELTFKLDSLQGKDAPLITYCDGSDCGSSEDLAYDLQSAGFTNIFVFYGGWSEWVEAGYPVEKQ
ncbi:MAG: hypothetical protein GXO92_04930 [FCB group bacterium]|nr:hypothetical protein [FCB group bacterium]